MQAVRIDREIFGKLLVIGQSREIPIQELMKYELASVRLTLFCLDGSFRKTVKSAALVCLEADTAVPDLPRNFQGKTLHVIDFMMLLQMSCRGSTECRTFGDLSDKRLRKVCQLQYQYVAVVGDNYKVKLSIKGVERTRRGSTQIHEIKSLSRNTLLPKQRQKKLFNQKSKINISNFVMSDWIRKGEAELEQDRYLYLSGGFSDMKKAVCVTNGRHTEVDTLHSDHEEADSRMFVHIHNAMETFSPERVSQLQRIIPVHSVARNLGRTLCAALPVIHALSGCNSANAFSGIGKKRWLKVASQHPEIIERLCYIGQHQQRC